MPKFLREHAIEPNSRQRYAEVLRSHAIPYTGHRRVAEISRETFHRLLTVVLKDEGVGHTHASWLIGKGVDLERVRYRLGHGDLTTTTRYVTIPDEEDSTAVDAIATILGDVA